MKLPDFYEELREIFSERQSIHPSYVCEVGIEDIHSPVQSRLSSVGPSITEAEPKVDGPEAEVQIVDEPAVKRKERRNRPPTRMESVQKIISDLVTVNEEGVDIEKENSEAYHSNILHRKEVDQQFLDQLKNQNELLERQTVIPNAVVEYIRGLEKRMHKTEELLTKIDARNIKIKEQNTKIISILEKVNDSGQ